MGFFRLPRGRQNLDTECIMKRLHPLLAGLALLHLMLSPIAVQAAMEMFLRLDGIQGESAARGHEGEIDILSWSWGLAQSITNRLSGGSLTSRTVFQDITLQKYLDKSTPELLLHCSSGGPIARATLTIRKAGDSPGEFYRITLTDVMISRVEQGGAIQEDRFTEQISINFATIKVEYTVTRPDGSAGGRVEYYWDIERNTAA